MNSGEGGVAASVMIAAQEWNFAQKHGATIFHSDAVRMRFVISLDRKISG